MKFAPAVLLMVIANLANAGPAEDKSLRQAALNKDIVAVKAALQKGANPNAPSKTRILHDTARLLNIGLNVNNERIWCGKMRQKNYGLS